LEQINVSYVFQMSTGSGRAANKPLPPITVHQPAAA